MRNFNHGRIRQQIRFLRCQFIQDANLPFSDVLSNATLTQALAAINVCWKDRIYSPLVTLWVFLGQVMSADHSCRSAVARLIAHRISNGQSPCSSATGAYCQARKRLPEKFFSEVACQTGRALETNVKSNWLWKGRHVYMFDGATVSMPDTEANQQAYPQPGTQKPGLGFPLARIAAVFSLSCGAVLDLAIARYAGKGQGELSLLHTLWHLFKAGDVLLTDRLMCSWTEMAMLKARGVDSVSRLSSHRKADFRRGKRLAKGDHIVKWPKRTKPRAMDRETFKSLPEFLTIREVRVRVSQRGFRTRNIIVVTTILDTDEFTKCDLAELYLARWNNELDLRSLKQTMQMDILRCKTPELVRKEIWTHILAYNLIRTIIAQSAVRHDVTPRSISFKTAIQILEAFKPIIAIQGRCNSTLRKILYGQLLDAIAVHKVGNRPNRFEPRRIKRKKGAYDWLTKPRDEMKRHILKQLNKI